MAEIIVTTADDVVDAHDGVVSLREAIALAESTADDDTIVFDASLDGQEINLQSTLQITAGAGTAGTLSIDGDTDGDGDPNITISGDADDSGTANGVDVRIMTVGAGVNLTLNALTLADGYDAAQNGNYSDGYDATSMIANSGTLSITNSLITGGVARGGNGFTGGGVGYDGGNGAAITNSGTLTITDTLLDDNQSRSGDGSDGYTGTVGLTNDGGDAGQVATIVNTGTLVVDRVFNDNVTLYIGDGGDGSSNNNANGGDGGDSGAASIFTLSIGSGASASGGYSNGSALIFFGTAGVGGTAPAGFMDGNDGGPGLTGPGGTLNGATSTLEFNVGFNGETAAGDTRTGTGGADLIIGLVGDETVEGGYGRDTLFGGGGNDLFVNVDSHFFDNVTGGAGNDTLDHSVSTAHDTTALQEGAEFDFLSGEMRFQWYNALTNTLEGIEEFRDSDAGNIIIANDDGMNIQGNGGDDTILAGAGVDTLNGGNGTDLVSFENVTSGISATLNSAGMTLDSGDSLSGFEAIQGTSEADTFYSNNFAGSIAGGAGDDIIVINENAGPALPAQIDGGADTDTIRFDNISAGNANIDMRMVDILSIERLEFRDPGYAASQTIDFNASQFGNGGLSTSLAIEFDQYADTNETVWINLDSTDDFDASGFTFSTADGGAPGYNSYLNIVGSSSGNDIVGSAIGDLISGGSGNDTISGLGGQDTLNGGDNADSLNGGADNDLIEGGNGLDTLVGGNGNDTLVGGFASDLIFGGADNDLLVGGQTGNDTLDGGDGIDTAAFDGIGGAVTVSLLITGAQNTGAAGTETIRNVENLIGGVGNDRFTGTTTANELQGGQGSDTLIGLGGNDLLEGGDLNDLLQGGNGEDTLNGDEGIDVLVGGGGQDALLGGSGNDQLRGGADRDVLIGGAGRDILIGGDAPVGGGAFPGDGVGDVFLFLDASDSGTTGATRDTIRDFEQGLDVINLAQVTSFNFVGTAAFTGTAGELRYFNTANSTIIRGDIDGDGVADFELLLTGVTALTASDFVLDIA